LFAVAQYGVVAGSLGMGIELALLGGASVAAYYHQIIVVYVLCAAAIGIGCIASLQERAFRRLGLYLAPALVYLFILWDRLFGFTYLSLLILGVLLVALAMALQRFWRSGKVVGDA
jgi:hypothetical protein